MGNQRSDTDTSGLRAAEAEAVTAVVVVATAAVAAVEVILLSPILRR